jgi:hypothetical protein
MLINSKQDKYFLSIVIISRDIQKLCSPVWKTVQVCNMFLILYSFFICFATYLWLKSPNCFIIS